MNCLVSAIALRRKSLSQFGARATSREELRHRSNRNLPESATTNKLRPLAFPKNRPRSQIADTVGRPTLRRMVAHIKKSIPHQRRGSLFACDRRTGLDRQLETETRTPKSYGRHAMPTSELPLLSVPPTDDTCPACKGTGSITGVQFVKRGTQRIHPPRCPKCGGTGRIPEAKS